MAQKWILRKGSKESGFQYVSPTGTKVRSRAELERVDALRIPPAWREVHVAASTRAPIQAWGFDARGRKQYRYHARAVAKGALRKHYRVRQLATDLPRLKKKIEKDFLRKGYPKRKICAGIVLLISDSFMRVGSERYRRENNTFGITTLRKSHVFIDGEMVIFDYPGKRSIQQRQVVVSPSLSRFVASLLETPGSRLFRYQREGQWVNVDARDVNEYLGKLAQLPYTAKDFRTWGGSVQAATVLADLGPAPNEAARNKNVIWTVRMVASELGNTPAITRKSYIHPVIISRYLQNGSTIVVPHVSEAARRRLRLEHSPEERALVAFLKEHFPERRTKRRKE
jgi:DNA topoisomerase-1